MSAKTVTQPDSATIVRMTTKKGGTPDLFQQYCVGAIQFAGSVEALYDRHLVFDRATEPNAARPSDTENIYKICAESFAREAHLQAIMSEAQEMVNNALDSGVGK